jgi:hypothetical protein
VDSFRIDDLLLIARAKSNSTAKGSRQSAEATKLRNSQHFNPLHIFARVKCHVTASKKSAPTPSLAAQEAS